MALDLGVLLGHLEIDPTKAKSGVAEGITAIDKFEREGTAKARAAGDKVGETLGKSVADGVKGEEAAIRDAGEDAGESFTDGLNTKAAAGAVAAAAVVSAGFAEALNFDASSDKLVASLGASAGNARKFGKVAGNLYADAWGDSLEHVNEAIGHVVRNIAGMRRASRADLEDITAGVLDVVTAFDQDLAMTTAAVGQLMRTGMAKDARDALDIITVGLQGPANKADDFLETINEYGTQFRKLGLDGRDAVLLMSQGLRAGARDSDIAADALKEFSLRAPIEDLVDAKTVGEETVLELTDVGAAFEAAGYKAITADGNFAKPAERLQRDLAGGGEKARTALDKLLEGVRNIEDPMERTRVAVALFGTQAEDMGDALFAMDLPKRGREMDEFKDASRRMSDQLNGNSKTSLTEFTREMKMGLVGYLEKHAIPFVEDEVVPAFRGISDALKELPGWAVKGTVGGLLGALLLGKVANIGANTFSGLSKLIPGKGGTPLGKVGKSGAVPVWVVNSLPGSGGPGGGTPVVSPVPDTGGSKGSKLARGLKKGAKAVPFVGTTIVAGEIIGDDADKFVGSGGGAVGLGGGIREMAERARGVEKFAEAWGKVETMADRAHPKINDARQQVKLFGDAVSGLPPAKTVKVKVDGVERARALLEGLGRDLDWVTRPREARITIAQRYADLGLQPLGGPQERAGGGPVLAGMPYLVGEREPELFVPNQSGRILNQRQMAAAGVGGVDMDRLERVLTARLVPLMQDVTIKLTDMRDVEAYARGKQVATAGGGVNF